ncbi:venom allergen 5-like [Tachypleus tridentatus]|uniref:venom allergen 5-like n=1 Tax=Tachypleus tridentatus TaxID=6853 RepID=UPI003FCF175F
MKPRTSIFIESLSLVMIVAHAMFVVQACPFMGSSHTMCIYRPMACPGKKLLRSGGLSVEHKQSIVHIHNKLRAAVARGQEHGLPAASNMRQLSWDEELSEIAQRWADQCMDGHDQNRNVERFPVGQNVAIAWTFNKEDNLRDEPDWETQVKAWYDEYKRVGFNHNHLYPFKFKYSAGHFSQVVWGDTYKVGCGYTYHFDRMRGFSKIYVCNYGPGGNVISGTMYQSTHKPFCSTHGLRPSVKYYGLCEEDEDNIHAMIMMVMAMMHEMATNPHLTNVYSNDHSSSVSFRSPRYERSRKAN